VSTEDDELEDDESKEYELEDDESKEYELEDDELEEYEAIEAIMNALELLCESKIIPV
jgi:hypothetical protein